VGQGFLIVEVSRSHSYTPHAVGHLWASDRLDAETCTWQQNIHKRQTSMPQAGFEPEIPASGWPQTHTLDCAATGIGHNKILVGLNYGM